MKAGGINSSFEEASGVNYSRFELELPYWADFSIFKFIQEHRKILECKKVSEELHKWINLIFGVWSTGRLARQYSNLYNEKFSSDPITQKMILKRCTTFEKCSNAKDNHVERYLHETFYQGA